MENSSDFFYLTVDAGLIKFNSENYDINFSIIRTDDYVPDTAFIQIHNIIQKDFSLLLNPLRELSLYMKLSDKLPLLLFNGNVLPSSVKSISKYIKTNNNYSNDIRNSITAVDSLRFYSDMLDINYIEAVSALTLIKDCAASSGIKGVFFSKTIQDKVYSKFKALGSPCKIIKNICNALEEQFYICGNNLYVGDVPSINLLSPVLDLSNSSIPVRINSGAFRLITKFNSSIRPGGYVNTYFPSLLVGEFRVSQVYIYGNTSKNFIEMSLEIKV